ncbi:MAG: hypothetical protein NC920_01965 [Candidatus Omnitrophica bacterium]|nr:hypothetical protein [Candidatus Omnitrophota bacterium]
MIVPMKKVTLIVQAKDKETTIEKLAELGVLHIEHLQEPKGRELNLLKEEMQRLEEAKTLLSAFSPSVRGKERLLDGKSFIIQVIDLGKRIKDLKEYTYRLEEEIKFWETWGDFEPEIIKELEKKNIYIRLYQIPLRELKKIPEDIVIKEISSQKGMVNCLLISRKEISFPFKKIPLPEMGLGKMKRVLQEKKDLLLSLEKEMREKSSFLPALEEIRVELEKEKELAEAKIGMGEFGPLSYLRGYLPRESLEKFLNFSREQAWGILIADPSPEDSVPTLLRNPPWIRILDPLFRFLAILPGYEELDISFWFLIFLCLFFGILIGDAGYGMANGKWRIANSAQGIVLPLFAIRYSPFAACHSPLIRPRRRGSGRPGRSRRPGSRHCAGRTGRS